MVLVFTHYKTPALSLFPYLSILFLLVLFPTYNKHATIIKCNQTKQQTVAKDPVPSTCSDSAFTTNHQEPVTSRMTQSSSLSPSSPTTAKHRLHLPLTERPLTRLSATFPPSDLNILTSSSQTSSGQQAS